VSEALGRKLIALAHQINRQCARRIEEDGTVHPYLGYFVRDEHGLESAVLSVFQTVFGHTPYENVYHRAAALMSKVADAHAFGDGKRTALHLGLAYLRALRVEIQPPTSEEGALLVIGLVEGTLSVDAAADQLRSWTVIDKAGRRHRRGLQ